MYNSAVLECTVHRFWQCPRAHKACKLAFYLAAWSQHPIPHMESSQLVAMSFQQEAYQVT